MLCIQISTTTTTVTTKVITTKVVPTTVIPTTVITTTIIINPQSSASLANVVEMTPSSGKRLIFLAGTNPDVDFVDITNAVFFSKIKAYMI